MKLTVTVKSTFVNPSEYHSHGRKRGDPAYPVSATMLHEFFQNPAKWRAGEPTETDATAFGSLVDCLVLTPDLFEGTYAVMPADLDRRTKAGREWAAQNADKVCITAAEHNSALAAAHQIVTDPEINALLAGRKTQVWVQGEYFDDATGLVVPVRCLIDLVPYRDGRFGSALADLKTTRAGDHRSFARSVFTYGYHWQAAWDLMLWNAANPDDQRTDWLLFGCESTAPYAVIRRKLHPAFIDIGRFYVADALRLYCRCLATGVWPGYDDGWTEIAPEQWMLNSKTKQTNQTTTSTEEPQWTETW